MAGARVLSDAALLELAREAGLQVAWRDAAGLARTVSPESLRAILQAMGLACSHPDEIADSRARLVREQAAASAGFITATVGRPVRLPVPVRHARLFLEDGDAIDLALTDGGGSFEAPPAIGYHRLELDGASVALAVAPARAFTLADVAPGRRLWGAAAQVYSLRGERPAPFGDFTALAQAARALGRHGADALAVSPVHALFAADPDRYGPYAPSTRLFLNVLYADPATLDPEDATPEPPGGALIDWPSAGRERLARLRRAFERFDRGAGAHDRDTLARFRHAGGEDLERHARFEALHAALGGSGWRDWPAGYHDPAGPAVQSFATERAHEVAFHVFAQWLADRGLARAQAAARAAGMAVGLIADLAVGMDAGGSHAWSRPQDLLMGLSVGAPPDIFQPAGQDWGLAAFSPLALRRTGFQAFIATLRSAMHHAGGVRIDHAMGLQRLWLTPQGADASQGAYLSYPFEDMVRLIALESARARAVVVGEDLGTVPDGFRDATTAAGVMGMRVLWFERGWDQAFQPPCAWDAPAMAMTTTHDLPTVAGWWAGRDIDWQVRLGRRSEHADADRAREARAEDRARLWTAATDAGLASGPPPAPETPQAAVDAAITYVAAAGCNLAVVPLEDILGLEEQPNLPGVTEGHPNWRRRLDAPLQALLEEAHAGQRIARLNAARPR